MELGGLAEDLAFITLSCTSARRDVPLSFDTTEPYTGQCVHAQPRVTLAYILCPLENL